MLEKGDGVRYAIIGTGRLAGHMAFYLESLSLPFRCWGRNAPSAQHLAAAYHADIDEALEDATHVLVLIRDDAIEDFLAGYRGKLEGRTAVHCSGSLFTPRAQGAHPLMTFTRDLYPASAYARIPFVVEKGDRDFSELLPGLPNPHFYLTPEQKPLYHALCVLSGNFTSLLWAKFFADLEDKLGLPRETAYPYLEQICRNLKNPAVNPVTGPLVRGDLDTIEDNLAALRDDPFRNVYEGFLRALGLGESNLGD